MVAVLVGTKCEISNQLQACGQTDVDAEVAECEVILHEVKDLFMVCYCQHFNLLCSICKMRLDYGRVIFALIRLRLVCVTPK